MPPMEREGKVLSRKESEGLVSPSLLSSNRHRTDLVSKAALCVSTHLFHWFTEVLVFYIFITVHISFAVCDMFVKNV